MSMVVLVTLTIVNILLGCLVCRMVRWCDQSALRCEAAEKRLAAVVRMLADGIKGKP